MASKNKNSIFAKFKQKRLSKIIAKNIKRELKNSEKEKQRCKNSYKDWEDNEFNMLDNRFLWAAVAKNNNQEGLIPSFSTLNDAVLYYNRLSKMYFLDIDLSDYYTIEEKIHRLNEIYEKFIKNFSTLKLQTEEKDNIQFINNLLLENHLLAAHSMQEIDFQFRTLLFGLTNCGNQIAND